MSKVGETVVIVGIARTPMGAMQGIFKDVPVVDLGAAAIKGALKDANIMEDDVSEVIMGCVLPAGVGQAPARQASLAAGVPMNVPTTTVNKVCGSGMKAVFMAAQTLLCGHSNIVVAGGMENMSRAPYLLPQARSGYRLGHGELQDHMFLDGLQDAKSAALMGTFAENTAERYTFSRKAQDDFALGSLSKAQNAEDEGRFSREVSPVIIRTKKETKTILCDESLANAKPEKIPSLRPAFKKDGTVTAANSSSIADGAAALVLMRKSDALAKNINVLAEIVCFSEHAQEPEWFTTAPVQAMKNLESDNLVSLDTVDLFEINEAFSVVTMAAMKDLSLPPEKVNVNGGACALGHPLGASGARVLVTLVAALENLGKKQKEDGGAHATNAGQEELTGVASLCIGGGEAVAIAVRHAP